MADEQDEYEVRIGGCVHVVMPWSTVHIGSLDNHNRYGRARCMDLHAGYESWGGEIKDFDRKERAMAMVYWSGLSAPKPPG
jgi:hypothetical protein